MAKLYSKELQVEMRRSTLRIYGSRYVSRPPCSYVVQADVTTGGINGSESPQAKLRNRVAGLQRYVLHTTGRLYGRKV